MGRLTHTSPDGCHKLGRANSDLASPPSLLGPSYTLCPLPYPQPDLYMGPNVRTTVQPARRKGRSGGAAAADAGASQTGAAGAKALQKPVVNCLRCGKIYDCRVLSEEGRRFLGKGAAQGITCPASMVTAPADWPPRACPKGGISSCSCTQASRSDARSCRLHLTSALDVPQHVATMLPRPPPPLSPAASGGVCTFCGSVVTLCYADGTTNAPPDVAGTDTEAASSSSSARVAGASASAAATGAPSSGDLAGFKPEAQQGNAANSVAYNDSAAAAVALKVGACKTSLPTCRPAVGQGV